MPGTLTSALQILFNPFWNITLRCTIIIIPILQIRKVGLLYISWLTFKVTVQINTELALQPSSEYKANHPGSIPPQGVWLYPISCRAFLSTITQPVHQKRTLWGTSLVVQCLGPLGGPVLIPGQGTKSHMPQLKIPHTTRTCAAKINKYFKKEKRGCYGPST